MPAQRAKSESPEKAEKAGKLKKPRKGGEPRPMRISDVARAAGVSVQTVEYYILVGLLKPIRKPDKPGRYFDARHIQRVRLIQRLNRLGYTLRSIRETYLRKR